MDERFAKQSKHSILVNQRGKFKAQAMGSPNTRETNRFLDTCADGVDDRGRVREKQEKSGID